MRDILTFLAGLLLLTLLAALAAPALVDWSQHRAWIEERLKAIAGVDVVTTGPIAVRLLPSARIEIDGVRMGEADALGSRLAARRLVAEAELTGFLRGRLVISRIALDEAELVVATRGGAVVPPASLAATVAPDGVGELAVTRGSVRIVDADGGDIARFPVALRASSQQAGGPWRIEGEAASRSFRIATGDHDGRGRVRARAFAGDGPARGEFDGWAGFEARDGALRPLVDGAIQLTWPSNQQDQPHALQVAGQGRIGDGRAELSGLMLDSPGAGRLEGQAQFGPDGASLTLRGRRFDAGPWLERHREGLGAPLVDAVVTQLGSVTLSLDQLAWRGEEASDVTARVERTANGWALRSGAARFAGASLSARPEGAGLVAALDAPDMRRVALALERLGLPAAVAGDLGLLGDLSGEARIEPAMAGAERSSWLSPFWRLSGRFGQAEGSAEGAVDVSRGGEGTATRLRANVVGADLVTLIRPAAALLALAPGRMSLDLAARRARLGSSPPGEVDAALVREGGVWSVRSVAASGFDGLRLSTRRDAGDVLAVDLAAQRADAVAAVAERLALLPEAARMLRALRGVSPLNARGAVTPLPDGWAVELAGSAGALGVAAATRADRAGATVSARLALESADRGLLFRALGLPEPAARRPARFVVETGPAGVTLELTGEDGLRAAARAGDAAGPFPLTIAGPASGFLPALLGAPPDVAVAGAASARLDSDALRLEDVALRVGGELVTGALELRGSEAISGQLSLPALDAGRFATLATGGAALADAAGGWSGVRFAEAGRWPALDVRLASRAVSLPGFGAFAGSARLVSDPAGHRLVDIALEGAGAALTGEIEADRAGSQLTIRARMAARGVDLSALGEDFAGRADIAFQLGAFGESPARLAASLNGGGEIALRGVALGRFDPAALERLTSGGGVDIAAAEPAAFAGAVRRAVEGGAWRLADRSAGFLVAGGVARLGVFIDDKPNASGAFSGLWDARGGQGELRAAAALKAAPRGWSGAPPQLAAVWRGPWRAMTRAYDASALSNALSQAALQREIERVEAFEADIRERAMFNRRLRAERERAERERLEREQEEARLRAETDAARQAPFPQTEAAPQAPPPLPPPVTVPTLPQPLSRQPQRTN